NDGAFADFTERGVRDERVLYLEHGKPLIFGKNKDKGIVMRGAHPEVVTIGGEGGVLESDIVVHDETVPTPHYAFMLSQLQYPKFPEPVGVLRSVEQPTYDEMANEQIRRAKEAANGSSSLEKLLNSGDTWTVE
ncbi:2-oxoacid:ferredoxin oxidoreductase subunit beta, partial [bacterium]|nr:2-oxoacid:ferredoxin oxidoreductase subunit beta [bacterium]